jgi:LCP family protein required for cell wall assembly
MGAMEGEQLPASSGAGLLKKALLGAFIVFALTAAASSTAVLLEADRLVDIFRGAGRPIEGIQGALDDVDSGGPQTVLVLGSDRRYIDIKQKNPVRSDTILLVRLDQARKATAVMSIPRDLKVDIRTKRGVVTDKINAAYAQGGPRLAVETVKRLLGVTINHVVNVNFGGFRRAVDRLGCVYVDVDKDYFNDNMPPNGGGDPYAAIDIDPGYQKMCGTKALDYVRYRHFDNDFVRAARQQDFLRQAKEQIGLGRVFGDRDELLRVFSAYTDTDLRSTSAILRLLKLAFESSTNPIREVKFRGDAGPTYVTISKRNLRLTIEEFLNGPEPATPAQPSKKRAGSSSRSRRRPRGGELPPGVIAAKDEGLDNVADASLRTGFPLYYPSARLTRGRYVGKPRVYDLYDRGRPPKRFRAYRIVAAHPDNGQYYGVQGTSWGSPPILDNPTEKMKMRGRDYELFYDGRRLRLVAWKTERGVYWVSNSLSLRLSNPQMLAIARSLTRVGGGGR